MEYPHVEELEDLEFEVAINLGLEEIEDALEDEDDKEEKILPKEKPKSLSKVKTPPQEVIESLETYMRQLNRFPVLTKDEEVFFAKKLKKHKDAIYLEFLTSDSCLNEIKSLLSIPNYLKMRRLFSDFLDIEQKEKFSVDKIKIKFDNALKDKDSGNDKPIKILIKKLKISSSDFYSLVKMAKAEGNTVVAEEYKEFEVAKKKLVECNLKLVFSRVKKFLNRGLSLEDLIQDGNLGLLTAIDKFDYKKGNKFSTYAIWWIEQAFGRAIANKSKLIRIPVHMVDSINRISRVQKELESSLGRDPSNEEMSVRTRYSKDKIEKVRNSVNIQTNYLDEEVDSNSEMRLSEFIEDKDSLNPEELLLRKEVHNTIRKALATLTSKEEKIIRLRFGIGEAKLNSLKEIGDHLKMSVEGIRKAQNQAIHKMNLSKVVRKQLRGLR